MGKFGDHYDSFAKTCYLKFTNPDPNIIRKYLAESPGNNIFLLIMISKFSINFIYLLHFYRSHSFNGYLKIVKSKAFIMTLLPKFAILNLLILILILSENI